MLRNQVEGVDSADEPGVTECGKRTRAPLVLTREPTPLDDYESGAEVLRWGPPNSAWTMDYRTDRVNVRYDEARQITEITCG